MKDLLTQYNDLQELLNTSPKNRWYNELVRNAEYNLRCACLSTSSEEIASISKELYRWWKHNVGYDTKVIAFTPCTHREEVVGDVVFQDGYRGTLFESKGGFIYFKELYEIEYRPLSEDETNELINLVYSLKEVDSVLIQTRRG
jgi:hypothetical protein